MKILVLDNYDSFTYNLVHLVKELGYGSGMDVFRNDKISLNDVNKYDKIILSPGPGLPKDAGIMPELIKRYAPSKSILGVCLGHQAIAEAFSGKLLNMPVVLHGIADMAQLISDDLIFKGLPREFKVCRYHSWTVIPDSMNGSLEVTAVDQNYNIMALRHREFDVRGLQFHPESIITEHGKEIMKNWLEIK
ncbi:MAG: aminodeoxychorismate/anthranilate synthase component II [Bacteroidetes bacterium]|nr:aminodeoxychorismate/anthranilate synthase component II [Bacteroidota bacterium]MDA1119400.1 aminodeoxychorismate/anthranilate synthase component II [Bacteroidota bacterium]